MTRAKILVLGNAALVTGFQLAGLEYTTMVAEENFQKELERVLMQPEFGIIIVNEDMLNTIDWRLKKKLDNIAYPVIIPMPGPEGESAEGDEIKNLIKRALGFDLSNK
jgi:vacuolar-type H+-ATPase subunit F/Vma7